VTGLGASILSSAFAYRTSYQSVTPHDTLNEANFARFVSIFARAEIHFVTAHEESTTCAGTSPALASAPPTAGGQDIQRKGNAFNRVNKEKSHAQH
jgi:hypothetical protein